MDARKFHPEAVAGGFPNNLEYRNSCCSHWLRLLTSIRAAFRAHPHARRIQTALPSGGYPAASAALRAATGGGGFPAAPAPLGGPHRLRPRDALKETDLLPDFLTDIFVNLLGYTRPAQSPDCHTLSRETHVVVDGQQVDAVLGRFRPDGEEYVVAVEGKDTRDPLEIPFGGRRMSAVDQCYRYAINLPCDWIIVTSMRETRLYHKGSNQHRASKSPPTTAASSPTMPDWIP